MNPKKITVFIFAVLLVLFGLTYLSKPITDAETTTDGFSFFGKVVKYPTTQTFFATEAISEEKKEQIDSIVDNIQELVLVEEEEPEAIVDTILTDSLKKKNIPDFSKIDTSKIQRIAYPKDGGAYLEKLKTQLNKPKCRIIHYGDSQLEGDRISAYVRNRLQGIYGGGGPGFIPIKQVYHQLSADVTCSENWLRFAVFDPTQKKFEHMKYGVFTSLSRFTEPFKVPLDSINTDTLPQVKATMTVGISKRSYANLRTFKSVTVHYGNAITPVKVAVFNDEVLLKTDSLVTDTLYHTLTIKVPEPPTNLRFEFETKISPDFYGITLDTPTGVALDNVAMRGASGTIFGKLSGTNFKAMADNLKPDVFIFQYGGNTVPYLKDSIGVDRYARYMLSNINWVRNKVPDASILFIGPSDMTTSKDGLKFTYPLLPYLNEKLKETCLANNIAYWDMFHAMGGENSMQHWVDQNLASTDYTHFGPKGTKVISELFFMALYLDLSKDNMTTGVKENEVKTGEKSKGL